MVHVVLQSSDGKRFKVNAKIAKISHLMKTMLDKWTSSEEEIFLPISISDISGDVVEKVISWMTYHEGDSDPDEFTVIKKYNACEWDKDFMDVDLGIIQKITQVANYLDIRGLFALCCQSIAREIVQCKTTAERREKFGLTDGFTSEEEERIRKENVWQGNVDDSSA